MQGDLVDNQRLWMLRLGQDSPGVIWVDAEGGCLVVCGLFPKVRCPRSKLRGGCDWTMYPSTDKEIYAPSIKYGSKRNPM